MSQFERNYSILIDKIGVASDATSLATLAEGEIAVINSDNGAVLTPGDTITTVPIIKIVRGGANGAHQFSSPIKGVDVVKWTGSPWSAAVEQQTTFVVSCADVATAQIFDEDYTIVVVLKQDKVSFSERQLRRAFTVLKPKFTTIASNTALATLLYNQIVTDPYFRANGTSKATAAINVTDSGTGTLTFDGLPEAYKVIDGYEQVSFQVAKGSDIMVNCTVTDVIAPTPGVGTYHKVKDLEYFGKTNRGITNFTKFPTPDALYNFDSESTGTYDIYVIDNNDTHPSGELNGFITSPLKTFIAIPSANTTVTTYLESVLNPWMATTPGAFAAVTL
jgi:hypothetical protein